jgi:hypothetical protein
VIFEEKNNGKEDPIFSVIKNPSASELSMVRRQGRCGPSHCHTSLGLYSNGANTKKTSINYPTMQKSPSMTGKHKSCLIG